MKAVRRRNNSHRNEIQSHLRKRPNDFVRPDVNRDRKHFRHDFGQFHENFQTTRPSNPAALHRLISPFARISRQVRK